MLELLRIKLILSILQHFRITHLYIKNEYANCKPFLCVLQGSLSGKPHLNYSLPLTNIHTWDLLISGIESESPRFFCKDKMMKVKWEGNSLWVAIPFLTQGSNPGIPHCGKILSFTEPWMCQAREHLSSVHALKPPKKKWTWLPNAVIRKSHGWWRERFYIRYHIQDENPFQTPVFIFFTKLFPSCQLLHLSLTSFPKALQTMSSVVLSISAVPVDCKHQLGGQKPGCFLSTDNQNCICRAHACTCVYVFAWWFSLHLESLNIVSFAL